MILEPLGPLSQRYAQRTGTSSRPRLLAGNSHPVCGLRPPTPTKRFSVRGRRAAGARAAGRAKPSARSRAASGSSQRVFRSPGVGAARLCGTHKALLGAYSGSARGIGGAGAILLRAGLLILFEDFWSRRA